jgi:hypothetical protein
VQLYNQPRAYRGRLVSFSGRLRSAERLSATKNAYGVDRYYKLAIEVGAGTNPPVVIVYSLELPDGLEQRRSPHGAFSEPIRLTGFFFKRLAYKAQDTIRLAPLLAAKTVDWIPAPAAPQAVASNPVGEIARNTLVALVLLGLVWFAIRKSAARTSSRVSRRGFVIPAKKAERSPLSPDDFLSSLANDSIDDRSSLRSKVD